MAMDGQNPNIFDPLSGHPKYRKLSDLNAGASGFVQLALDQATNTQVAIKFIERGSGVTKSVVREILNHRLCAGHPYIIQFREVFLTAQYLAIAMEYATGGDMFDYVYTCSAPDAGKGLPEDLARWFFQQLVIALDFCHRKGIANRDIKLENTLLSGDPARPLLKICDFGYSKNEYVDSRPKTLSGTPDYIAPEVLLHNSYDGKTADIWSCGVMLFAMLVGCLPFWRAGDERANSIVRLQQIFPRILNADFQVPVHASQGCLDLLKRMLTVDPSKRATLQDILSHPWFMDNLPPEVRGLNDALLQRPVPSELQSVEEIMRIVQAATQVTPWPGWR